jgi:excinuclease ABC subunit A
MPMSIDRGYTPGRFSFNVKGGRCEECQGEGVITTQLYFMPDVEVTCAVCKGARFSADTLDVTVRGKTISDVLNMSVEEGVDFFAGESTIGKRIEVLHELGLSYLTLGQSATTLSGGEAQRIKIASHLGSQSGERTLYVLDEPTTGLHFDDIVKLLAAFRKLLQAGHSLLVIEHNLDVLKTADWIIDLGPEGGDRGGRIVAEGSPESIIRARGSHTASALAAFMGSRRAA